MSSQILETFITALSSCPLPLSHVPSAHFSVSFSLFCLFNYSPPVLSSHSLSVFPPYLQSLYCFTSHGSQRAVLCSVTPPSVHLFLFLSLSLSSASLVTYSYAALLCSSLDGQQSITIAGDIAVEHGNDPGCLKNICCD